MTGPGRRNDRTQSVGLTRVHLLDDIPFVWISLTIYWTLTLLVFARWVSGSFLTPLSPITYGCLSILVSLFAIGQRIAASVPRREDKTCPSDTLRPISLAHAAALAVPSNLLTLILAPSDWTPWHAAFGLVNLAVANSLLFSDVLFEIVFNWIREPLDRIERTLSPFLLAFDFSRRSQLSADQPSVFEHGLRLMREPAEHCSTDDLNSTLVSEFVRRKGIDGTEMLIGNLLAHFQPGARHEVVHIPLSPPFPCIPQVQCDLVKATNESVRVKVAAVFPFGIRLEFRRNSGLELAESARIVLEVRSNRTAAQETGTVKSSQQEES